MAIHPATRETHGPVVSPQVKSTSSILAIIAAIGSFLVANAALKFGLAIGAVLLGMVGLLKSTSSRVSGGVLSMIAIVIAGVGLIAAILDAVGLF